ncbi:hypothetical protein [Pseudohoeflea coraliihabitans]|uniref:Uncharacterized protein n=1 Tax=Pseudohoeflea coraliihabitans TaxID=2860393 RepID=A0ABS6WLK0_9HYPH|nr:hypothetical protein [Pseudohoeflea sp. DP4N28-3]MBW3096833.1 hypothetical protein [Pseudohoeflea sp. DP4N28-3]
MIILGFDPSKYTGWAVYDTDRHLSAMECGILDIPKKADPYFAGEQIALRTTELLRQVGFKRIDFAVLEEQALAQIGRSNAAGIIYPWVSTTAVVGQLAAFQIPYGTLPSGTWRTMFFGKGFKPPKDCNGKNAWKAAAIAQCEMEGITLPTGASKHNAAEACAVAVCWREAKVHAGRYHEPLMRLLQKRNEREAA